MYKAKGEGRYNVPRAIQYRAKGELYLYLIVKGEVYNYIVCCIALRTCMHTSVPTALQAAVQTHLHTCRRVAGTPESGPPVSSGVPPGICHTQFLSFKLLFTFFINFADVSTKIQPHHRPHSRVHRHLGQPLVSRHSL